jgi:hypothetical protein
MREPADRGHAPPDDVELWEEGLPRYFCCQIQMRSEFRIRPTARRISAAVGPSLVSGTGSGSGIRHGERPPV